MQNKKSELSTKRRRSSRGSYQRRGRDEEEEEEVWSLGGEAGNPLWGMEGDEKKKTKAGFLGQNTALKRETNH